VEVGVGASSGEKTEETWIILLHVDHQDFKDLPKFYNKEGYVHCTALHKFQLSKCILIIGNCYNSSNRIW
jgi:hypothetical protein